MADAGYRPVRELDPTVARKIAAGEVIDRPSAVVRELIDNAIDAGSSKITAEIAGGGIESIRIADDGHGMTAEDLALCAHTHTTSKISSEDDLLSLSTLGFRGEALSSINAVSRLEITTTRDGREAWKLQDGKIVPSRLSRGTVVAIQGLFENFPARRQFLKRPATETGLCRQIFAEKALAWPGIEFRLSVDGKPRDILPAVDSFRERWLATMAPREGETFFHELSGTGNGFSFSIVLGSPDAKRADRRDLMIFVNGRRIQEYSLLQALEYGAEGHFPNGTHPAGALYVTVDPALVDFNIHPAKREARFRDSGSIHHAVSQTVRAFYRRYAIALVERTGSLAEGTGFRGLFDENEPAERNLSPGASLKGYNQGTPPDSGIAGWSRPEHHPFTDLSAFTSTAENSTEWQRPTHTAAENESGGVRRDHPLAFRYLGQTLGTFILVEKDDAIYAIDQHAAHERILFDELFATAERTQELLVPYRVETPSEDDDKRLEGKKDALRAAGFAISQNGTGIWEVTAVPVRWNGTEADLRDALLESALPAEALVSKLYAGAACKAACKDGDLLDPLTARNLAAKALALPEPKCPHGRPIWTRIDREELFRRVRRT